MMPARSIGLLATIGTLALTLGCAAPPRYAWPQWAGPTRDFIVTAPPLADAWPTDGPRTLWKKPLGPGNAGIATRGDGRLFTAYRDGEQDVIVALDADNGTPLWTCRYDSPTHDSQTLDFGKGPHATPLVLPDRLVMLGFGGKLLCVSTDNGAILWQHDLVADFAAEPLMFGHAASPLLYDGKIIVLVGGPRAGVVAFNPADGSVAWQSAPRSVSYASPILINVDGQDQLVFFSAEEIVGLNAATGAELWNYPCVNQFKNNCTMPIWANDNLLWVVTQGEGGGRVLRLSRSGDQTRVERVWEDAKLQIHFWNAVHIDGFVYACVGGRITPLTAINVQTGESLWRERGYNRANLLVADGKVIALDEDGKLSLLKLSPAGLVQLAQHQVLEKTAWTAPTLVGATLYARDNANIIALDLAAHAGK